MVSITLCINDHIKWLDLGVTNLGHGQLFLGHDWLKIHNPSINWHTSLLEFDCCPTSCSPAISAHSIDINNGPDDNFPLPNSDSVEEGDCLLLINLSPAIEIHVFQTKSMQLVAEKAKTQPQQEFEELIPPYLHDFHDVFEKKDFDELPPSRPWDHAIELLPGTEP